MRFLAHRRFFSYIPGMHEPRRQRHDRTGLYRSVTLAGLVALTLLFAGSLFLVFLNNRFTPSRAASRAARLTDAPGSTAVVKGFSLWFRESGTDRGATPVVVILGEAGQSGSTFAERFRFLEHDRRVILYDPRGCGNSQSKPELSSYTVANLVTELEAVRTQIVRADSIILIGHAFGGTLALHYALTHPGEVERLVLISPLPGDGVRYESIGDLLLDYGDALAKAGLPPRNEDEANLWHERYGYLCAAEGLVDPRHAVQLTGLGGSFGPARALLLSLASGQRPVLAGLRTLATPTLILYGEAEGRWTRESYQLELQHLLPRARAVRFEKSGHWLFLEEHGRFADEVLAFLNNHTG